jgi:prolipoprotein diacylglyceryltransferase
VLFAPLGVLAAGPWRAAAGVRARFLAAALRALVPALAVARLGCLAAGCCWGTPTSLPWGLTPAGGTLPCHPTPLYEIAGLLLLGALLARLPERYVPAPFAVGFGALRLAIEPFRAAPPLGAPALPVAVLAGAWIAVGLGLACALSARRGPARPQGGGGAPPAPDVRAASA